MPDNDRDVFDHLTKDENTSLAIDYLTYAVFANEKREWIKLFEQRNARTPPTQAQIDEWIANLTESQYDGMRANAESYFSVFSEELFASRLEVERQAILRSAIIAEVKSAGLFWKQAALALITAIVAPLVLGGIIAAVEAYDRRMYTPTSLANHL